VGLSSFLPSDPDDLLALEPEELAMGVLKYIAALSPKEQDHLDRHNFGLPHVVQDYPHDRQDAICHALMEAWAWLENEGILIPKPGAMGYGRFLSRRARQLVRGGGFDEFRASLRFPRDLLHPKIEARVRAEVIRGDFESAVFKAFKEVEVAVREAGDFTPADYGPDLMRRAFNPTTGPLRDRRALPAEREATANLFAGAIGLFKNPISHRWVGINDPTHAAELTMLASHLMRIVDGRRTTEEDASEEA
jgi:uncharacterized protein (TIGR02391 family)